MIFPLLKRIYLNWKFSRETVAILYQLERLKAAHRALKLHEIRIAIQAMLYIFVCQAICLAILIMFF